MKKTRIYYILLAIIAFSFSGCYSEVEIEIQPLQLEHTSIEMKNGDITDILIESGNGGYLLSAHPSDVFSAELKDGIIRITAHTWGKAVLLVTDQKGKRASLEIHVTASATSDITPQFVWNHTIELEQANDWGITYRNGRVVLTNINEKRQYILTWNGDFSAGKKPNAVLTIIESNQLAVTHTIQLSSLSILEQDPRYYSIVFFKDDKEGKMIFGK